MHELDGVASLADAWIETLSRTLERRDYEVASLADAWIETDNEHNKSLSYPVASLADAWIETRVRRQALPGRKSRVPRGRVD